MGNGTNANPDETFMIAASDFVFKCGKNCFTMRVSRLATSTTLIPDAAICRANSLPIPDEAPVTSAHGPNCPLSSAAFIVLFLSVDCDPVALLSRRRGRDRTRHVL